MKENREIFIYLLNLSTERKKTFGALVLLKSLLCLKLLENWLKRVRTQEFDEESHYSQCEESFFLEICAELTNQVSHALLAVYQFYEKRLCKVKVPVYPFRWYICGSITCEHFEVPQFTLDCIERRHTLPLKNKSDHISLEAPFFLLYISVGTTSVKNKDIRISQLYSDCTLISICMQQVLKLGLE